MNLGKQLHKLGNTAYRHPWRVISFWLITLAFLGLAAAHYMKAPSSVISIPGTPAQQGIDRVGQLFPEAGASTGRIVYETKDGTIQERKAVIESLVQKISAVEGVANATSPFINESFISPDRKIAYSQVQLKGQLGTISDATLSAIQSLVAETRTPTLAIESGGDLISSQPGKIIGTGEFIGVGLALLVLVMTLGSLVAGGMPIVSALLSVGLSMAGLFALSQVLHINTTTPVLAIMLGLAVGIDYALFIVNKYRSLINAGYSQADAAARAIGTAGNAVVFAAITVIIALAALSVVNIPFMTTMGFVGAASVGIAALVAISLIPAMLRLAGKKVFSKKQRATIAKQAAQAHKHEIVNHHTIWYRWGKVITAHPIIASIVALAVIGGIAWPAGSLVLGLPSDEHAASKSTERKAYDMMTRGFGVGYNAPLAVVVEGMPAVSQGDKDAVRSAAMETMQRATVAEKERQETRFQQQMQLAVTPEQRLALQAEALKSQQEGETKKAAALAEIDKTVEQYAKFVQLRMIADKISKLSGVKSVQPAIASSDGTAGLIQVIPDSAPTSAQTATLIDTLRKEETIKQVTNSNGATMNITGSVALQGDINRKLSDALPLYIFVIVGLSLLLLVLAFRSILVPIKATLGFVLSLLAMFGAIVVVFQWGWFGLTDAPGPIVSFVPIIATGILFGLAMDYEFFLVSGMHEAYQHTKQAKQSVVEGFGAGSKVVTAAAIIMISVFVGFITNHETVIQSIGFGLAVGILIDAFLVRMTLVPAIMTLVGSSAWWLPKWLDRHLPHVSIEGEAEE